MWPSTQHCYRLKRLLPISQRCLSFLAVEKLHCQANPKQLAGRWNKQWRVVDGFVWVTDVDWIQTSSHPATPTAFRKTHTHAQVTDQNVTGSFRTGRRSSAEDLAGNVLRRLRPKPAEFSAGAAAPRVFERRVGVGWTGCWGRESS